ncbi:MAG: hypothetical protein KDA73_13930 [Rhodobacteraceae bacterium]|nr:hypothetical protein [Paracoccaceae bacterium]
MFSPVSLLRTSLICAAALSIAMSVAVPASAQSVQEVAKANCMREIAARSGGTARFTKVSSGRTPIVSARASGGVSYTCMTDSSGEPVRVKKNGASNF